MTGIDRYLFENGDFAAIVVLGEDGMCAGRRHGRLGT
jgi:hypothetical protein